MIAVENTVLLLLAAGQSSRFGDVGSKLDQEFLGRPLGFHVAVALEGMPFQARIAIVDGSTIDYRQYDFECLHNDDPARGVARSLRMGVARAKEMGAAAVLIALADMPRVTAAHIYRMMDAADRDDAVVASSDGCQPLPPALFGKGRFDELLAIEDGDQGAREMILAGRHVVTSPAELIDVDTPEELEKLRELVHAPEALTRAGARRWD